MITNIKNSNKKKKEKLAGPFSELSRFDIVTQNMTQIAGVEDYPEFLQNHSPKNEKGQQTNHLQNFVPPHHEGNASTCFLNWGRQTSLFFSSFSFTNLFLHL